MRRRDFIAVLGSVLARPVVGRAQSPRGVPRIGFLTTEQLGSQGGSIDAFQQGLRELGYVEGRNVLVDYRTVESRVERYHELATELVDIPVDLIVATNSLAGRAARQATSTLPIIVPVMGDPVADGLVASIARPGGNVTGLTFLGPELLPKRLSLLKQGLPTISRVAALWHPNAYGERTMSDMIAQTEGTARTLGLELPRVAVHGPEEFEEAFSVIAGERPEALLVFPSPMLFAERRRIVALTARYRLPSMAMSREFPELGGLMSYGASIYDLVRRGATYVDKIIRGAKPTDLPVEQPTKFELAINLATAKSLGLTIPTSLLANADEVIE
jgi:putative ABC transport system substrate-binding protein